MKKLANNIDDTNSITFEYSSYDNVGNRLSMKIDDANAHCYTYDDLYQLTSVDYNEPNTTSYCYDALGNRTDVNDGSSTSYSCNSLNQYVSVGGTSYDYDDNGNLIDDGTYLYYYDCENRLTDVNNQSDNPVASYSYDYLGRRVSKTVYGSPNVTTQYCYDGDQVIAEYQGGSQKIVYVYGAGIDEPIFMYNYDISKGAFYHFDGLGNVIALSNLTGDLEERYSYDVFGEPNRTSSIGNPYLFTGRQYDNETGLYYYRARYYNPKIGQFMQTDPIGYSAGLNLYTYVWNNPVIYRDPYGNWPVWSCIKCWWEIKNVAKKCINKCRHICDKYCGDYDAYSDCMLTTWPKCKKDCMAGMKKMLKSCAKCSAESY